MKRKSTEEITRAVNTLTDRMNEGTSAGNLRPEDYVALQQSRGVLMWVLSLNERDAQNFGFLLERITERQEARKRKLQ